MFRFFLLYFFKLIDSWGFHDGHVPGTCYNYPYSEKLLFAVHADECKRFLGCSQRDSECSTLDHLCQPCETRTTEKGIGCMNACKSQKTERLHIAVMLTCCCAAFVGPVQEQTCKQCRWGRSSGKPTPSAELLATERFWRRVLVCRSMPTGEPARLHGLV